VEKTRDLSGFHLFSHYPSTEPKCLLQICFLKVPRLRPFFLSNESPNCPSESIKARSFLDAKNIFVISETV
jgi:hypothetical protein